jgi:glycine cleavage system H lipoate-binding protein/ABC-type phosphate transport system substrate-binding protein
MKKFIYLLAGMFCFYLMTTSSQATPHKEKVPTAETILILCSPDIYPVVQQWGSGFSQINSDFECSIEILNVSDTEVTVSNDANLSFISQQYFESSPGDVSWKVTIGRDVMIPVINSENPLMSQFKENGIKISDLAEMLHNPDALNWSENANGETIRLHYYLNNKESKNSIISSFINGQINKQQAIMVNSNTELVTAIQNDVLGLGFCRLNDIVNTTDQSWLENISILPIDKNNNGKLDYFENFYLNPNEFARAVWIGKYPKKLVNNFYVVAEKLPEKDAETAFLKWVVNDGQSLLAANGFTELVSSERMSAMDKINHENLYLETASTENYALLNIIMMLIILSGLVVLGILIYNATTSKDHSAPIINKPDRAPETITENDLDLPDGVYYDKTHTWVFMEKDGTVKVGIDDFLQRITGPYTRIKMKNPGERLKKNEALITLIQDGKQLNVYAPISGKIMDINEQLFDEPAMINASPYTDGWIYMIKPSNYLREIQFLRMSEKYREWLKNEIARLKDFLALSANMKGLQMSQISYQDGGEIINHVLHEFGPEIWEDFQKKFIETSVIN